MILSLQDLFNNIYNNTQSIMTPLMFVTVILISLVCGAMYLGSNLIKSKYSSSFLISMALLPVVVCVVIMMVNGNIGIGVAVAGAFSLVRFRSAPGNAKEICLIFMAMCSGLICGVGYVAYAILFTFLMSILCIIINIYNYKVSQKSLTRLLKITIPEDLNYTNVFDDIFKKYTTSCDLIKVKTSNLGSLFTLTYNIKFKASLDQKEFMDELRVRNGNLEIVISRIEEDGTL